MKPLLDAAAEAVARVKAVADAESDGILEAVLEDWELKVVGGLCGLQLDALRNDCSDACLIGLAEVTIQSLLSHLQTVFRLKMNLEDFVASNFLVDTMTVGTRKTSLDVQGRIRDHKLQVGCFTFIISQITRQINL